MLFKIFYKKIARLSYVVGAECGSHGYALRLTKSIILHGANKIDGYLRYLIRRILGQKAERYYHNHLYSDQHCVPAYTRCFLHKIRYDLRNYTYDKRFFVTYFDDGTFDVTSQLVDKGSSLPQVVEDLLKLFNSWRIWVWNDNFIN